MPCSADFVLRAAEPPGRRVLDDPPTYLHRAELMGREATVLHTLVMDTALGDRMSRIHMELKVHTAQAAQLPLQRRLESIWN